MLNNAGYYDNLLHFLVYPTLLQTNTKTLS